MDYQLSAEETKLQENVAAYCKEKIAPRAKMLDGSSRDDACKNMKENIKLLAEGGCLKIGYSANALNMVEMYLAGEEIARACPSTYLSSRASAFFCAGAIKLFGNKEQQDKYINAILNGEKVGAFAYSEEQAGTDIAGITTVATKEGNKWILTGKKDIVVNAPIADVFIVLSYSDKNEGKDKGMSMFIVDKSSSGMSIGAPIETLGLRGCPIASVSMNGCAAELLGNEPGKGHEELEKLLSIGTIGVSALCVGIGLACMEGANAYAKTRMAFGKRIGIFQDVGFRLADMFTYNDLGRMLALRAAWGVNQSENNASLLSACAKLFASEAVTKIVNWGMQIFAGHGYISGSDIERYYRDAKFGEICEGTSEMQRAFISKYDLERMA